MGDNPSIDAGVRQRVCPEQELPLRITRPNDNLNYTLIGGTEFFGSGYVQYPTDFNPFWLKTTPSYHTALTNNAGRFLNAQQCLNAERCFVSLQASLPEREPAKYFLTDNGLTIWQEGTVYENEKVAIGAYVKATKTDNYGYTGSPQKQEEGATILFKLNDDVSVGPTFWVSHTAIPGDNGGGSKLVPAVGVGVELIGVFTLLNKH